MDQLIAFANQLNILTFAVGILSSYIANLIKNGTNTERKAAVILAGLASLVMGALALFLQGGVHNYSDLIKQSAEVFTVATFYYHLILRDQSIPTGTITTKLTNEHGGVPVAGTTTTPPTTATVVTTQGPPVPPS